MRRPTADTGADQTLYKGTAVTLDGNASSDADGTITDFAWLQTAGLAVSLSGAATVSPGFTAPDVSSDTTLTFELTVTDDQNDTGTDTVDIVVQDATAGDTTPPVTTGSVTSGSYYWWDIYDITLSADEPATTWFRITGTFTLTAGGADTSDWQEYTGPIEGYKTNWSSATLEYYSIDTAGNQEATQAEDLE